jgi:hypothetical protein
VQRTVAALDGRRRRRGDVLIGEAVEHDVSMRKGPTG